MTSKKEKGGYTVTRQNLKPLGSFTLPAVDELEDSQWLDLISTAKALTPEGEDLTNHLDNLLEHESLDLMW